MTAGGGETNLVDMGTTTTPDSAHGFLDSLECGVLLLDRKLQPAWQNRYYTEQIAAAMKMCDENCFTGRIVCESSPRKSASSASTTSALL